MKLHKSLTLAYLALLVSAMIWGATIPIMKLTLLSVPLFSLALIRFGGATLLLFPFVKDKLKIKRKHIFLMILAALTGTSLNIFFFFLGVSLTTALNTSILIASTPIFTFALAHFFLKEHVKKQFLIGAVVSMVGMYIIIGGDFFTSGIQLSPKGDLLILLAVLCSAVNVIVSKKVYKYYTPSVVTFYMFLIGALSFLPFALYEFASNSQWIYNLPPEAIGGIIYGILFSSFTAYLCWQRGLLKVDASKVGLFLYIEPITSTLLAVSLLNEKITMPFVIGAVLIMIGVIVAEGHLRKKIN